MADDYSTPIPQDATVGQAAPLDGQASQQPNNADGGDEYSTPIPQGASIGSPSDQSFNTPSGRSYQVGQQVQHSSGATGTVTGQHPGTGKAIINWLADMGQGEVATTASGLGGIDRRVSKIPGIGRFMTTPLVGGASSEQAQSDLQQVANDKPDNLAGSTGSSLAKIIGFIMGGEALKGVGYSDQLLNSSKLAKALEDSPMLLKLATIGHNAIKAGGIAGLQDYIGGGSAGDAATTGAQVGGVSAGLEGIPLAIQGAKAIPGVIGKGLSALDSAASRLAPSLYPSDADYVTPDRVQPDLEDASKPDTQTMQDKEQLIHDVQHAQVRNHILSEAQQSGIDLQGGVKHADSLEDVIGKVSQAAMTKAKGLYSAIDDAVEQATGLPGKYQKLDDNIYDLEKQLREGIGDPDKQQAIQDKLNDAIASRSDIMSTLTGTGLEDAPDEATRLFKQAKALEELKVKAARNTTGLPISKDPSGVNPEKLNPKTFSRSLKVLDTTQKYGGNRLRQALPNTADQVIKSVEDARVNLNQLKSNTQQATADAVTRNNAAKSAADEANAKAKDLADLRNKQVDQIKAKRRAARIAAATIAGAAGASGVADALHGASKVSEGLSPLGQ